ncbi:MAG: prepilin-type N-terminal cleavage/methylation domain-containing protein [Planctomycetes bacterium]|nr:prepilin-type N-terminal cleavage/methylation domain-containing protein [Planctomycetota bacterium]
MKVNTNVTRTNREGFTLVEVLVVVVIISILVSAVVMMGSYVTTNAKIQKTKSVMSALNSAINEYQLYHRTTSTIIDLPQGDLPPQMFAPPLTDPPPIGANVNFYGIVRLYIALNTVPSCEEIISQIPENNMFRYFDVDHVLVDAWRNENIQQLNWLRYEYVQGSGNFPVIRSAGPDLLYGTADDILSTEVDG